MKAFIDFIPVLLFFLTYIFFLDIPIEYIETANEVFYIELDKEKSSGIYFATLVLMISYSIQCFVLYVLKQAKKIHLVTLIIILVAGFSTLYFKNPLFIKVKPSIVYWGFALFFIVNALIGKENMMKKLLQEQISLDEKNWKFLTNSWIYFFVFCGFINLYVAHYYSEETWVEFKFYVLGIIFPVIFIVMNGVYLSIYAKK